MGYSSELMIAEQNRNEAKEAIKLIEAVQFEIVGKDYESAAVLQDAIELIKKFSGKHQPEIQRCK